MNPVEDIVDIEETAALWAVRLAEGHVDAAAQAELDAWLALNTRHLGALVRAQAMWVDTDRVAALMRGNVAAPSAPVAAVVPRRARKWWRPVVIAASFCAVALMAGLLVHDHYSGRHVAGLGEVLRVPLADGSTITLNTETVVQVRFTATERRVILQKGEANFDVAQNPRRPFVVEAGEINARAIGTEFVVRRTGQDVAVTVVEGVVEVVGAGAVRREQPRLMGVNEQVVVSRVRPVRETGLSKKEVTRQLSWREGYLVFDGERLDEAVSEVNRYVTKPVRIDDPALGRERFVGAFRVGDARAFARSVAVAFDARMDDSGDAIVLHQKKNSSSQ